MGVMDRCCPGLGRLDGCRDGVELVTLASSGLVGSTVIGTLLFRVGHSDGRWLGNLVGGCVGNLVGARHGFWVGLVDGALTIIIIFGFFVGDFVLDMELLDIPFIVIIIIGTTVPFPSFPELCPFPALAFPAAPPPLCGRARTSMGRRTGTVPLLYAGCGSVGRIGSVGGKSCVVWRCRPSKVVPVR